jgi:hypothetical protein
MSDLFQSGQHPDADQLSAFAEHALTAQEYEQTVAHLAVCADCRMVVSLALPPVTEPGFSLEPVPRRPWFSGWIPAWAAVAAFATLTLIVFQVHRRSASNVSTPPTRLAASLPPAAPAPVGSLPAHALPETAPTRTPGAQHPVPEGTAGRVSAFRPTDSIDLDVAPGIGPANVHAGLASPTLSQARGSIQGTLTDPSGAVVKDAEVTATNTNTGVQTTRRSGNNGEYSIQPLQAGPYNVEVVAQGFQRLLQENIAVNSAASVGLNMKLPVGGQNQTVTVTNAPPFLDTANASLGGTIENQLYSSLPLSMNGGPRDPAAFQPLMPGAAADQAQGAAGAAPAAAAAPTAKATPAAASANSGIFGGAGQTNLNQNYIEGIPAVLSQPSAAASVPPPPRTTAQMATAAAASTGQVTVSGDEALASSGQAATSGRASGGGSGVRANAPATLTMARSALVQHPLPSGLAALSAVAAGQLVVAVDSSNALFLSKDRGLHWTAVPAQWKSHAVRVSLADAPPQQSVQPDPPVFEITTDTDEHWFSADGRTWKRK